MMVICCCACNGCGWVWCQQAGKMVRCKWTAAAATAAAAASSLGCYLLSVWYVRAFNRVRRLRCVCWGCNAFPGCWSTQYAHIDIICAYYWCVHERVRKNNGKYSFVCVHLLFVWFIVYSSRLGPAATKLGTSRRTLIIVLGFLLFLLVFVSFVAYSRVDGLRPGRWWYLLDDGLPYYCTICCGLLWRLIWDTRCAGLVGLQYYDRWNRIQCAQE